MAHFELIEKLAPNAVIKVIGVGGGGGNAVAHMVNAGVEGVEFITANTDAQAIKHCGAKTQLQLQKLARSWSGPRPDGGQRQGAERLQALPALAIGVGLLVVNAASYGRRRRGLLRAVKEIKSGTP